MSGPPGAGQPDRLLATCCYVVLFLFGAAQALIGCFQYSRGPVPLIAVLLAVVIFVTCLLCGWGMSSFGGGLVPALGWIVASFVLSMPSLHGSVIITATTAGEWYLYGGAFAAAGGAAASFILWARDRGRQHR